MEKNTLPKEVLKKVVDGWARANGVNDHEVEAWYNNDAFNGFRMKDCLTFDEYKAIWLEEEKKMIEFFEASAEEPEIPTFPYCPECGKKLENGDTGICDGDIVLCDKCFMETMLDDDDEYLPFQAGFRHLNQNAKECYL